MHVHFYYCFLFQTRRQLQREVDNTLQSAADRCQKAESKILLIPVMMFSCDLRDTDPTLIGFISSCMTTELFVDTFMEKINWIHEHAMKNSGQRFISKEMVEAMAQEVSVYQLFLFVFVLFIFKT